MTDSTTADEVRTPLFAPEDADAFDRAQHGVSVAKLVGARRVEYLNRPLPELARMAALELMGCGWIVDARYERATRRGSEAWVPFPDAVENTRLAALELMGCGWTVDAPNERARRPDSEAWVPFWDAVELAGEQASTAARAPATHGNGSEGGRGGSVVSVPLATNVGLDGAGEVCLSCGARDDDHTAHRCLANARGRAA